MARLDITQLPCDGSRMLAAPTGCMQYYLESSGEIKSFNFGGGGNSQYTVFKIDIFARNSVDQNNPMIALEMAISGPFRGAKNSCSLHF